MRDFVLVKLTDEEFDDFSARHPQGNFQQTSAMGRLRTAQGIDVEYLALKEGEKIVAAALFETHRSRFSTFAVIHDGPMCDYHDTEALTFFMDALKRHAKAKGASQLEITPESPYRLRDTNGASLPDDQNGAPDNKLIEQLEAIGFTHGGFTVGYTAVPRWRYLKDLTGITDEKSLLKSYDKRTQWSVKRAQSMGVHVRELSDDELGVFARIEQQTAERRSFEYRGEAYFHCFKEAFGSKAHFMVAEIHIDEYVGEETRNLAAAEKRLNEAAEFAKDGDVLPAAASLFVEHPREVIYLFSGSVEQYKPFYASALIQHDAMLHFCVEHGLSRYNFYGIDGVFDDPDDEGRGVLEFKQGFNGYVEELPGEFVLPVKPVAYAMKQFAHKLLSR